MWFNMRCILRINISKKACDLASIMKLDVENIFPLVVKCQKIYADAVKVSMLKWDNLASYSDMAI